MKRLRKALYPTRFDPLAFAKVEMLYPLRAAGLEEIVLLFVVDRDEVGFVPFGGFDRELAEDLSDRARLRFADWAVEIEKAGLRCASFVEVGRPAAKILEVAAREEADLIVTGRQRHVALDALYLGGTAMEILRRSPVPVFVCKTPEDLECFGETNPYERVLFSTDFTSDAAAALSVLSGLAGAVARVDVVHVIGEAELERLSEVETRREEALRREKLEAVCGELRAAGFAAEPVLRAGAVAPEILAAAADRHCTAIALATTDKEGLREFWLGSVSHRVAELSPVPVLLVPVRPPQL